MKAMILAAGEGTRLRPLTLSQPKPMLPVVGRPVLEHIIAWLRHYGVNQIAINLHHCPDAVIEHFGDGARFGVQVSYSQEKTILGTAGGVKRVANFFESTFVLIYGDVLTDLDLNRLMEFHFSLPRVPHLTMGLHRTSRPWECGIVGLRADGRVTQFVEKPPRAKVFSDWVNAGVLVMEPDLLAHVPEGCFFDFGRDLFPQLLRLSVPMYGWPLPEQTYLIDIGTPENYERVQNDWPTPAARKFLTVAPPTSASQEYL